MSLLADAPAGGVGRVVPLSGRLLALLVQPCRCVLRAHRRGAVCRRAGEDPGRAVAGGRASMGARRLVCRLGPGWLEPVRLRRTPAGLPLPKAADGRIVRSGRGSPIGCVLMPPPATTGCSATSMDAVTATRISSGRGGRTLSSLPWRRAGPRRSRCWTPLASGPQTTRPPSPPPNYAAPSSG